MKILYREVPSESLRNLRSLADVLGITAELVDVEAYHSLSSAVQNVAACCGRAIVLDVASLTAGCSAGELTQVADLLVNQQVAVLLLTTRSSECVDQFLQLVTKNTVHHVESVACAKRVTFSQMPAKLSKELCSQSYPRKGTEVLTLGVAIGSNVNLIMELDGQPSFVQVHTANASLFIWSAIRLFDVNRALRAEREFEESVDEFIPAIIFLRFAFEDRCWHNPHHGAGIVIDDPLLTTKYGFIDFPRLLGSARTHGYQITLAFIPWNHWRSRPKQVALFRDYSDCFAVCAHGCDHTNGEFRSFDYEELLYKNFVARQRMERHGYRTGLRGEPLMVCPQEQYSIEAMRAFSDSRQFIGLICTACMPRNLTSPQISGADLLLPAQDSFFGFPVFKRHYWGNMSVFGMALFLGKPAILVEHHEFFRDGSGGAEEFVRRLAELRPDLKWKSLMQTVTHTHARRRVSERRWEVRFFSDTFHFEHELQEPTEFRLIRRLPEMTHVQGVCVGGREVQFSRENGFLTFEIHLEHPQKVSVQVDVTPFRPAKSHSPGVKYQASVALRRGLSELRDNVLARHPLILRATTRLMKSLKQTAC